MQLMEKEFRDVIYNFRLEIDNRDLTKLIDRYINTVTSTIDTEAMLEQMQDGHDSHRSRYSSSKKITGVSDNVIVSKVARKLDQKGLSRKVIMNFEKLDEKKTQYLSFEDIKYAFHRSDFKLSSEQIQEMLTDIKQDRERKYNYHHLL